MRLLRAGTLVKQLVSSVCKGTLVLVAAPAHSLPECVYTV